MRQDAKLLHCARARSCRQQPHRWPEHKFDNQNVGALSGQSARARDDKASVLRAASGDNEAKDPCEGVTHTPQS